MTTQSGDEPMPQHQYNTAQSGGVVYAVQDGDQYVYLYRHKPPYRVEPLPAGSPPVPDPLVRRAPSWLLSAQHQVVPFYGRDDELAWLRDWRDSPTLGLSARLVHASSGQGKTRLAAQFAEVCTRQGWTVAVARHRSEAAAAGGTDQQLAVYKRGLVLIVDYAERWPLQDVLTLLGQHQAAASTPVRVLLLARPAGGWWQSLVYQLSKANIDDVGQWELATLAEHLPDRRAIYAAARDRFATVLGLSVSTALAEPDLSGPQFELVLAVHMKALVDVDAAARGMKPPSGRDQAGLSSYLLDREHDYWRAAHQDGTGPVRTSEVGMSRTVYTAILTRALVYRDGVAALTRAKISEATTQPISQVLADHAVLYPPADPDTVLEPLYPDRLGEDFLALTTPGHTDTDHTRTEPWATTLPAQLLITDDGDGPAPPYARAAITILIEAAHRWPHLAERQLYPLLRQRPRLVLAAGGAALTRLADLQHPGIFDILQAIEPHLPAFQHIDLDAGIAALTTRLVTHCLATTTDPAQQASMHTIHGWRLNVAGQYDLALDANNKAVQIYHSLVGDPERITANLLAGFAQALDNLGITLRDLGRAQEALNTTNQAVAMRRILADADPVTFDSHFARSLTNLSLILFDLGRRQEALDPASKAVLIFRRLAAADPARFEPEFASALINLARASAPQDGLAVTAEAVEIFRRLAAVNPARFEPNLGRALHNLGIRKAELGLPQEALATTTEAVEIRRRLAAANLAKFGPGLVKTLQTLAQQLSAVGRSQDAVNAHVEAVKIGFRVTDTNPGAFAADLQRAAFDLERDDLGPANTGTRTDDTNAARAHGYIVAPDFDSDAARARFYDDVYRQAIAQNRDITVVSKSSTRGPRQTATPATVGFRSGSLRAPGGETGTTTPSKPAETSFLVARVWDLPNRNGLVTSGKTLTGKVKTGMTLQNDSGHKTRVLALEFLSPRDIATGEVTILLERTDPSPVQPQALLTATLPPD